MLSYVLSYECVADKLDMHLQVMWSELNLKAYALRAFKASVQKIESMCGVEVGNRYFSSHMSSKFSPLYRLPCNLPFVQSEPYSYPTFQDVICNFPAFYAFLSFAIADVTGLN